MTPPTDWIARESCRTQVAHREPLLDLLATLARLGEEPVLGDVVPPLAHWLYFHDRPVTEKPGLDGHPRTGGFLPPAGTARRMWAAGDLTFHRPFRIGVEATRRSIVSDVVVKQGGTGGLMFVTVDHVVTDEGGPVLTERQTIVYRDPASARTGGRPPMAAPGEAVWTRRIEPDPVLLFRYSALTFNSHRIHYDHPYAMEVEGYPGLVVHGPLVATLMLDECLRHVPGRVLAGFAFRAVKPLFVPEPFTVNGAVADHATAALFAADADGHLCMQATARFVPS